MTDIRYPKALPSGTSLRDGAYRIVEPVGQGGFGITYKAVDEYTRDYVAIKECFPNSIVDRLMPANTVVSIGHDDDRFSRCIEMLWDEADILARFGEESIVRVIRRFRENGTAYVVLEFISGLTLGERIRQQGPIPPRELDFYIRHLIGALSVLHDNEILHRDISPQNIMLRPAGVPVLIDFGSARYEKLAAIRQVTGVLNRQYAPPEQWHDKGQPIHGGTEINQANLGGSLQQGFFTDVYSLCGVLYYAVTGKEFNSHNRMIDELSGKSGLEEISRLVPSGTYSANLLDAIERGLRFKIEERPQTIAAFYNLTRGLREPEQHLGFDNQLSSIDEAGEAGPDAAPDDDDADRENFADQQLPDSEQHHAAPEAGFIFDDRAAVTPLRNFWKRLFSGRAPVPSEADQHTQAIHLLNLGEPAEAVSMDPGGHAVATVSMGGRIAVLHMRKGGREVRITCDQGGLTAVLLISPMEIVVGDRQGYITTFNIETREQGARIQVGEGAVRHIRLSPDNAHLVVGMDDGLVVAMTVSELGPWPLIRLPGPVAALAIPDPRTVLAAYGDGILTKYHPDTKQEFKLRLQASVDPRSMAIAPHGMLLVAALASEKTVARFNLENGRIAASASVPNGMVTASAVLGSTRIATGFSDGRMTVWEDGAMKQSRTYEDHSGKVTGISFTRGLNKVASVADDGMVLVYDLVKR